MDHSGADLSRREVKLCSVHEPSLPFLGNDGVRVLIVILLSHTFSIRSIFVVICVAPGAGGF